MLFHIGDLEFAAAVTRPDLLAPSVGAALSGPDWPSSPDAVGVAEIDPQVADTTAFCERYGVPLAESANCVIVTGRRDGAVRYAACVVFATTRADVNGLARRAIDVRKASFAATETAVELTSMEYGGITPVGLPADWLVLVDAAVAAAPQIVVGSGIRGSKLALAGKTLADLPGAQVIDGLGR